MKQKEIQKFSVTRETLRNLNEKALADAAGGCIFRPNESLTSGTVFGGDCCAGCGC